MSDLPTIDIQNPIFNYNLSPGIIKYNKVYPYFDIKDYKIVGGTNIFFNPDKRIQNDVKLIDAKKYNISQSHSIGFYFESEEDYVTDETIGIAYHISNHNENDYKIIDEITVEKTENEIKKYTTFIKKDSGITESLGVEVDVYQKIITVGKRTKIHKYYNSITEPAFYIDNVEAPILNLDYNKTYVLDQSDMTNMGNRLRFYLDKDKNTEYTEGVTIEGIPGIDGKTTIYVNENSPTKLYYQSEENDLLGYYFNIFSEIYRGELDYVSLELPVIDISNIRQTSKFLDENIDKISGADNLPEYASGLIERDMGDDIKGQHIIEYYLYTWEEMNGPFYHNGTLSLLPDRDQIADGVGSMHNYETNEMINKLPATEFEYAYTRVYTYNWSSVGSNFEADSSSNYVSVYKLKGKWDINDGLPFQDKVNIVSPKYSKTYFWWTYRIEDGGAIRMQDYAMGAYRYIPLSGFPPVYTPSVRVDQLDIGKPFPTYEDWNWEYNKTWGSTQDDYVSLDIIRTYKPRLRPEMVYNNQKLSFKIPEEELKDLRENYVNRFKPDRGPPKYKTYVGDIYKHPYEKKEIVRVYFNMFVFINQDQNIGLNNSGEEIDLSNLNETRILEGDYTYPYDDNISAVKYDDVVEFSNNNVTYRTFEDTNFDFDGLKPEERGTPLLEDGDGLPLDIVNDENDTAGENTQLLFTDKYFGVEYLPNGISIARVYFKDETGEKVLPNYTHMLQIPGWKVEWKDYEIFPNMETGFAIDISDNIYDVRWTYTTVLYDYDVSEPTDPETATYTDISLNHGISPAAFFDYREYGKIYKPKIMNLSYKFLPLEGSGYLKNLTLELDINEFDPLVWNLQANTDLDMKVDIIIYGIKPKSRADADQLDPPLDITSKQLDTYDISFSLPAIGDNNITDISKVELPDTGVIGETLIPGRYHFIWTYNVRHNNLNEKARNYPLVPGVDYSPENAIIDIPYNDFFYDPKALLVTNNSALDKIINEVTNEDILEIRRHLDTYFSSLSDDIIIKFDFYMWWPHLELSQTQFSSRSWSLPGHFINARSGYKGEGDVRLTQAPVEYINDDMTYERVRVWDGERNRVYYGEPGFRVDGSSYMNSENNKVYQLTDLVFENYTEAQDCVDELASLLDVNNFIVEMILPFETDFNFNEGDSGNFGFGNYSNRVIDTTFNSFHIGIYGDGETDNGFIYKPPYNPSAVGFQYYKHNMTQYFDISNNPNQEDVQIQYKFSDRTTVLGDHYNDVEIWINGVQILDLPTIGVAADTIKYVGVSKNYDEENLGANPFLSENRPTKIRIFGPAANNKFVRQGDLKETTMIYNIAGPGDYKYFGMNGEETYLTFPTSNDYTYLGFDIPYISKYDYTIVDLKNGVQINSTINTYDENTYQRKKDWNVVWDENDNERIEKGNSEYPFEHKYYYTPLFLYDPNYMAEEPYYPKNLQLTYNPLSSQFIAQVPLQEMAILYKTLGDYWRQVESLTRLRFIFYIWKPNSPNLPADFKSVKDIESYDMSKHNPEAGVYMCDTIITTMPNENVIFERNILPLLAKNMIKLEKKDLIYGNWVMGYNYEVKNDFTINEWTGPDPSRYDLKATSIFIPPIFYDPEEPILTHEIKDDKYHNIKISIPRNQLNDLSYNIFKQSEQIDISGIEINYYLWTPIDESSYVLNGWNLPIDYYGEYDRRTYGAPIKYEQKSTGMKRIAFIEENDQEFGYDKKKGLNISYTMEYSKDISDVDLSGNYIGEKTIPLLNLDLMSSVEFTYDMIDIDSEGLIPYTEDYLKNGYEIPYLSRWSYTIIRKNGERFESDISGSNFTRRKNWHLKVLKDGNEELIGSNINTYKYARLFVNRPKPPPIKIEPKPYNPCKNECGKIFRITKSKELFTRKEKYVTKVKNMRYAKRLRVTLSLEEQSTIYPYDPNYTENITCEEKPKVYNVMGAVNNSQINVVMLLNGEMKYVFNSGTSYNELNQIGVTTGEYNFKNVPEAHPIAFLNSGKTDKLTYYGDEYKKLSKEVFGKKYDFYYGNIKVKVYSNFGIMGVYCYYHGYMGGEFLIKYSDEVPIPINEYFVSIFKDTDDDPYQTLYTPETNTRADKDRIDRMPAGPQLMLEPKTIHEQVVFIVGLQATGFQLPDNTYRDENGIYYFAEPGGEAFYNGDPDEIYEQALLDGMVYVPAVSAETAINVDGYYPIYTTTLGADQHLGGDGTHQLQYIGGTIYYMPNGLTTNVEIYYGNYEPQETEEPQPGDPNYVY